MLLKFGSVLHPLRNQPGSNVSIHYSPTVGHANEAEIYDIEPKKIKYINFEWEERFDLAYLEAYSKGYCTINYNTFKGQKMEMPFVVKEQIPTSELL